MPRINASPPTPSSLTQSPAWLALAKHQRKLANVHLRDLFADDSGRVARFSLQLGGIFLDYSKHKAAAETLDLLVALARQSSLPDWISKLFAGDTVNNTENRPAPHMALRSNRAAFPQQCDVMPAVREVRQQTADFATALREGKRHGATGKAICDVVNIGVGAATADGVEWKTGEPQRTGCRLPHLPGAVWGLDSSTLARMDRIETMRKNAN